MVGALFHHQMNQLSFFGSTCTWYTIPSPWSTDTAEGIQIDDGSLVEHWQGPEMFVTVWCRCCWRQERLKQKILYVPSAALRFATFLVSFNILLCSVPAPELVTGARLAQRRVLGLKQKYKWSPGRRSHASWCENLILLMPIKSRSPKHSQEHTAVLPHCCLSFIHQLNSFSGVGTPTLLWLRECKHPFFHLGGQCLPPPGHGGGQGPISTLLNTTAPV